MKHIIIKGSFILWAISSAILVVLLFKPLFYWQVEQLNTNTLIGLDQSVVKANYDVLIDYLLIPFVMTLEMPDIVSSQQGLFHFHEVKQLFMLNNVVCLVSGVLSLWGVYAINKERWCVLFARFGKRALVVTIFTVAVLAIGFNFWFVLFHQVFFNNDAWLFNPQTDPIIQVLPESFFLLCCVVVVAIICIWWGLLIWFCQTRSKKV